MGLLAERQLVDVHKVVREISLIGRSENLDRSYMQVLEEDIQV